MTIDLTNPDDRASMISAIANFIISSNDDKSIRQHAELILDEYIIRTNHHIWLVNQCAKILKDVVAKRGLDVDLFMTNCEFHDYDKLHNSEVIPTYAIACHYFYFHNKKVDYKIDEKKVHDEFENVAWPKHHRANKHHVAEYYGTKNEKGTLIVPETNDFLSIIEMYADWMAMGITNGGTARDWWTKTYGEDRKWRFTGADIALIQQCIMTEHAAENQLAYLRQFKDVEPTWVPPTEIETHESENPIEINKVNEGIENFFNYVSNEDLGLKRDDLYIGPIDPTIIDPVKMMKLAEYPAYLLALKKWTTTPDHDLAPELMAFGKIVDEIYQFKNPITCYRGIRTGFSTRPKQNLMGVIDDEIEYLRLLKPGFNKPGATFEFETPEPMSVARSPYLAKVYGNFIVKTEVPPDAPKLVITPELSYLLQQMEVEYPEYRAVNLSVTHEVIVFAGVKLQFEIVSVYGDISSELETMRDHSLEGLGNTPMNGVYYSIDGISDEALLSFLNTGLYKTITNIAKPMYKPLGQNSWQHIQQVYSQASRICKKVLNRALTPVEYAAILFHDCSVIDSGKDDHEKHSADKAVKALADVFNEVELDTIHNAIVEHDQPQGPATFSSIVSQLVAAGDFNPPDVDWMLNKSYVWGISHGMEHEKRLENTYNLMRSAYGSKGFMYERMPEVYKKYFASKIKEVQKTFDKMTIEEAEKRIMEYRKKHHLSESDTSLPESSVEAISSTSKVVKNIPKIVYVATTSKSIGRIVAIDKKHAICSACKRAKDSNILSNYDNSSVSSSSIDISGYDSNKSSGVIRYKVKEITVYEIDTKELQGEFTYEGIEHEHILRYEGNVKDLRNNSKQIDHMTDVSVTIRYSPYENQSVEWLNLSYENYDSTEALAPDIKKKKQLIIDYICSVCDIMDPSKLNSKRYHRLLDNMSDKEFDQWMNYVKEGKWKIHIVAPNLVVTLKNENSLKAADKVKCKLFHRLWMTDDSTGRQYLTDNEYLVLNLPVRRQQQFLDEKMSVPDNDRQIDGMTGQVTGDSKSSAVTNPEIQILAARGLDATLEELVNVRGGNIAAYSDFKRQAEETGEIKLNSLDPNTRSRVAVVGQVLLRSMMIENNIVE